MKTSKENNSSLHPEALSPSLQVRKLKPWARTRLIRLLDVDACWMKLATVIHKPDGAHMYSANDIREIKDRGYRQGGSPAEALLEHWGTVGIKLPTLKDLIEVLTVAKLYHIVYYVSVELLKGDPASLSLVDDTKWHYAENASFIPSNEEFTAAQCANPPESLNVFRDTASYIGDSVHWNQDGDGQFNFIDQLKTVTESDEQASLKNIHQQKGENALLVNKDNFKDVCHFRYCILEHITRNFNSNSFRNGGCLLGEGAFGAVYHGRASDGQQLAIKRLKEKVDKQFVTEIEVLSKYRHPNLLPLLGYSCDGPAACLIYSFIANGSLQEKLAEKRNPVLPWQIRVKVSAETARGICHLHTFGKTPLVHRDIKSANVLLDENMSAKVGDFGLVRVGNSGTTTTMAVTQTVFGTPVYMAREAFRGDVSVKLDTFSYGVVLLELLTGLAPYDESREEKDLLSHVLENDDMEQLLDPCAGQWDNDVALALYDISKLCTEEKKKNRPTMVEVLPKVEAILK